MRVWKENSSGGVGGEAGGGLEMGERIAFKLVSLCGGTVASCK